MSLNFSEYFRNMPNQQMARRMDRKVIKLEAAYGSERQFIVISRTQDLIVRDLMEDIQKTFKIPMDQQVVFHKGTNLCDFPNETLEQLGIENNHPIRVTRDPELPSRTSRSRPGPNSFNTPNAMFANPTQMGPRETSPQRNLDPSAYQMLNNNLDRNNVVLKLYVSYGSEREYILVNGRKPLIVSDLKRELNRVFKIPPDQQCIVFKGFNIHDYLDEAPLEAFGLENNSPLSLWPKGNSNVPDIRLPRGSTPPPHPDMFSPRIPPPPGGLTNRFAGNDIPTEVLKIDVQHGSDRHMVLLKGQNKTLTVLDLQNELEKMTSVLVRDQKIFYKAQELHTTPFRTLKECELENNVVVKLVGEPSKLKYSSYFGRLNVTPQNQNQGVQQQQQQPLQMNQFQPQQQPQAHHQYAQPSFQPNFQQMNQGYQPSFYQQPQQQQYSPPNQQQQQQPNYGYAQNF